MASNKFNDTDLVLEEKKVSQEEKDQNEQELPVYMDEIELNEDQEKRLKDEIKVGLDQLTEERGDFLGFNLEHEWDAEEAQYAARTTDLFDAQFNIHMPTTKIKVDGISRDLHQSYMDVEPKYNISPRPEYDRQGGREVADKQTDFLDYKIDTITAFDISGRLVEQSAVLHGLGWEKYRHEIQRRKRKRTEEYDGTKIETIQNPETGQPVDVNVGLAEFLAKYPDAQEEYPQLVKKLERGELITLEAEYKETVYNDVLPSAVDIRNLYFHPDISSYDELCNTDLIIERTFWRWYELKAEEKKGVFKNVDELLNEEDKDKNIIVNNDKKKEEFKILECTYQFFLKETDDEPVKIICWIEEEKHIFLGATYFPFEGIDCLYNPANIKVKRHSLYQPGIAGDLYAINKSEDAMLNFGLEGAYISNMVTPITPEGSDVDEQFLNKEWAHGVPLNASVGEVAFLQSFMKPTNPGDIIIWMQQLQRMADDVSGKSSLSTGRESVADPNAPATKTLALLAQTDKNIRDYQQAMTPFYSRRAQIMLQMYYEISKEGRKYSTKGQETAITGGEVFSEITREEMVARTNIEPRVTAFDFDKQNEKREDLALLQVALQNPSIARRPESVHSLYRNIIKGWSPKWRNLVDSILPSVQVLKVEEAKLAGIAAAQYFQAKQLEAKATGQPLGKLLDASQFKEFINDISGDVVRNPSEDQVKARRTVTNPEEG